MEVAIHVLIGVGAAIMLANIIGYIFFFRRMNDTITSKNRGLKVWLSVGFVLIVFFLFGYVIVEVWLSPALITAFILFFGSLFVTIMILIVSKLNSVAKARSFQITNLLVNVVDARDPNLNGHSNHVKDLAELFYKYLPRDKKKQINTLDLEYAALLHDIGKLGVPESILNKPGKLDEQEWEIMKKHPKIAVKFLEPLESFEKISPWILYHHERYDGKGYYGKKPEETPFVSRLLSVCDTYSALTMSRSYKPARSHDEAIKIIKEVSGTQLDPELVELFLTIPTDELEACNPENK